jgi:hypothetical protein
MDRPTERLAAVGPQASVPAVAHESAARVDTPSGLNPQQSRDLAEDESVDG